MAVSPQNWRALADTPNSTTSTSLPATTATSTTSHSATNEPTNPPPISNSTGLSVGAKAGIGVSCGALGVFAIIAAAYFVRKKKATQTSISPTQDASFHALNEFESGNGGVVILPGGNEAMSNPKHEMSTESTLAPPELGADLGSPRELSTDQRSE
ncbi:hypothetical protein M409DRAFT_54780 [Zasmidium cellare ATCC 36951]|uniref:Mid2 domain-containing protein n=1 Tax=Zasmidium cellare ATCC 36951 TaxID=1080233 RepID=A0A6A6CL26_ZASCE|nr:uncharacterized protein M409DRAFT_54780 [Zasmidium cellare ATCC 36951]KAF2166429.1 hypothetical protein M409DRAFT_54780 [Zasmidium cellare ATCC 36951]